MIYATIYFTNKRKKIIVRHDHEKIKISKEKEKDPHKIGKKTCLYRKKYPK
jgi:hypothetical protein